MNGLEWSHLFAFGAGMATSWLIVLTLFVILVSVHYD